jgi:hypothetical protein
MFSRGLLLAVWLLPAQTPDQKKDEEPPFDAQVLKAHGVALDETVLLDYFRQRTLSDDKIKKIQDLIGMLGDEKFARREQATRDLIAFGQSATRILAKALADDPDLETLRRLQSCLRVIQRQSPPELTLAVLGAIKDKAPGAAAAVLLDYVPFADDRYLEEEILAVLSRLAWRDNKLDRAMVAALKSPMPARRAAAAFVLGRSPQADEQKSARDLLKDTDSWVRLRTAQGLALGKDKTAVTVLIDMVADSDVDIRSRAEELLFRLIGDRTPPDFADHPEKYRDSWRAWWKTYEAKIDLAALTDAPHRLGFTLGIEWNTNKVWECGPDGKMRWVIACMGPMDAQILPGNRVLIAESNGHEVTERDFKGNVLWRHKIQGDPINCQRLANGNTFIGVRSSSGGSVLEVRKDGSVVAQHTLIAGTLYAVRRLKNGHYVGLAMDGTIEEIDGAGKKVRTVKSKGAGDPAWKDVDALPGGRYLVSGYHNAGDGLLREIDSSGKTLWELKVPSVCGFERLDDGRFLCSGGGRVVIITRTGQIAWQTTSQGFVRRVHRR